jgi:hypothetical protein
LIQLKQRNLAEIRDRWRAVVNAVRELQVPCACDNENCLEGREFVDWLRKC